MQPADQQDPAVKLASAATPIAMRDAAIELSKPGLTARAAKHPSFSEALFRLQTWVREGEPKDRLVALAVLARLRKQGRAFPPRFEAALARPMSPLDGAPAELEDPREREYLAQGLGLITFPGLAEYLAGFVAGEGQTRTDARDTAALLLLRRSESLSTTFELLRAALHEQSHDTQDPATSRMRRLIRVLESVQEALRFGAPIVSAGTGEAYAQLLRDSISGSADREVSIEVTNTALAVLLAWVRPNFSAALNPETFRALQDLRRVFLPARWPDETRESRLSVGHLLREAIALLALAGVTDDKLRRGLALAVDNTVAEGMLRQLAKETPGIPNEVRHWLETGQALARPSDEPAMAESILETVDRDLAEAYREGHAVTQALKNIGNEIQEAVTLANPALADGLEDLLARLGRLTRRIEAVSAKRGFELQGIEGEAVEYAPADHAAERPIAGARIVRLVSPMVVRRSVRGAPQLILKGKVDEA